MAARWGRLRGAALRIGAKELVSEEAAAARLEQERRAKAARLRRIQRLLEPPGAPERELTRLAMEQMRYLRRDSPEEWPISRLAHSFGVSRDVVGRVLRSRFSPSSERAAKQDGLLQPQRSGLSAFAALPEPPGQWLLLAGRTGAQALAPQAEAPRKRGAPSRAIDRRPQRHSAAEPALQDQVPLPRGVQKGREFVDGDGNFLYRIPA